MNSLGGGVGLDAEYHPGRQYGRLVKCTVATRWGTNEQLHLFACNGDLLSFLQFRRFRLLRVFHTQAGRHKPIIAFKPDYHIIREIFVIS